MRFHAPNCMKALVLSLQHHEYAIEPTISSVFPKSVTSPPIVQNPHIIGKGKMALEVERLYLRENPKCVIKVVHYGILVPLYSTEVEWPGMPFDCHP